MSSIRKHEIHVDEMLSAAMGILEDLHIVHKKTAFDDLLATKLPGSDITVAKLINNLFKIIKPVIEIARKSFPALFAVLDWAEEIVRKLLQH